MAGNLQIHSSDLSGYQQYKIHLLKNILLFNKPQGQIPEDATDFGVDSWKQFDILPYDNIRHYSPLQLKRVMGQIQVWFQQVKT